MEVLRPLSGGSQRSHRRASNRKRSIQASALQEAPAAKVTTAASVKEEQPFPSP